MLYSILKPIVKYSLNAYFKKIDVIGAEHLEHSHSLFVCNHPSALFDPIIVASRMKKPIHFLAGAEWFGSGVQKWIFKNQFKMLPVYRPWLAKDKKAAEASNDDMFKSCYEALNDGKRIIIFPEASSVTVPWIRSIKTGVVRIKLGAEMYHQNKQDIKIIPIGLNYTNPHRFQTRVVMNVGSPIDFSDFDLIAGPEDKELVLKMTQRVHAEMSKLVYYEEQQEQFEFIKDVKKLMTGVLKTEIGVAEGDVAKEFEIRKQIVQEINAISEKKPERVKIVASELRSYITSFEEMGFRQYNPFEDKVWQIFVKSLGLVLGIPLFLAGTVYNLFPYLLSLAIYKRFFSAKVTKRDAQGELNSAFAGSLGFASGLVVFLIWYIVLWIVASQYFSVLLALGLTIIIGYISGRFAMLWYKWFVQLSKFVRWNVIAIRKPSMVKSLLNTRSHLIEELLDLRKTSV